jgi:hypothetical protein
MQMRFFAPVKGTGTQNDKSHFFNSLWEGVADRETGKRGDLAGPRAEVYS